MALGAGRWRIGRQLAVESLLLSAGGLGLSVWLVDIGLEGIRRSLPQGIAVWFAGWRNIGLHGPAFAFGASVALATTVLFGLLPLARLRRAGPGALDLRGRASSAFGRKGGLSGSLVVVQVSLALVLLAGAAATVRGFLRLVSLYEDLDPDHVVTMHLGLSDASRGPAFFGRLVSSVGALPGVRSVAAVSQLPGDLGPIPTRRLRIEGRPVPQSSEEPTADLQTITPDYFRALRVRFVRGRMFDGGDGAETARVAILSESAARRYFPQADPIGARVSFASDESESPWRTIVGVVSDVRQYWFDRQARPTLYVPLTQSPRSDMFLLIRSEGDPAQIVPAVRREVREIDPGQPVEEVRSLRGVVDESAALVRIGASTLSVTGLLALLLSAVGIFGVVSYTSARSTRDIGIRMALGARPSDVLRSVMAGAARLSLLGTGIGLAGAVVLTRLLSTALFGIAPGDPYIFGAVVVLLLATAAAACYFPARRATKVDPAEALRAE
jgi:predicted permease